MTLLTESGFKRELRLFGKTLRTSDGKQLIALVSSKGSIEIAALLGGDPRGSHVVEILAAGAVKFKSQAVVTDVKTLQKYTILKPLFDGPDYTLRFEAERQYDSKK